MKKTFQFICILLFSLTACEYENIEDLKPAVNLDNCKTDSVSFQTDIEPIFVNNCNIQGCHGNGSIDGDFTTYQGIKNKIDDGDLIRKEVITQKSMPKGTTLSDCEIRKLTAWLDAGAPNN